MDSLEILEKIQETRNFVMLALNDKSWSRDYYELLYDTASNLLSIEKRLKIREEERGK